MKAVSRQGNAAAEEEGRRRTFSRIYASFLSTSLHLRRHSALHISQIGTCALRESPHQNEDSSIINDRRAAAEPRATTP